MREISESDIGYIVDADDLTPAQLAGDACVVCHVRWPRPRHRIGSLPNGRPARGCGECAGAISDYLRRNDGIVAVGRPVAVY
ncbi:hypothetical protein [Allonocardiopsis opalescens]|uniref:Uncharacterized protein n=1 Tax=Allonocardiopsis opalescens TaxID=1144618 RepID=A0A2T0PVJ8_9ACTN|nr:hypothetical protein [Allonocardiopsis opalescens]PRX95527.1 hypothetical protein CLV72_109136 [Allonocardiopsis opalescens]